MDSGTEIDVCEFGGVIAKEIRCPKAGAVIFQHVHDYDHISLLASGKVEVWMGGVLFQIATAPKVLEIPAGIEHRFVTLVDDTAIYCIHNANHALTYTPNSELENLKERS